MQTLLLSKKILVNTLHKRNWDDIKKIKDPKKEAYKHIRHINTFLISLLTFMTIRSQNRKFKLNPNAIRALGLLKVLENCQKRNNDPTENC